MDSRSVDSDPLLPPPAAPARGQPPPNGLELGQTRYDAGLVKRAYGSPSLDYVLGKGATTADMQG